MPKSRYNPALEDYEDPDEDTMHEFWEADRARRKAEAMNTQAPEEPSKENPSP